MQHCEKLGSRAPPVQTIEQWNQLSRFLQTRLYNSEVVIGDGDDVILGDDGDEGGGVE